MPELVIPGPAQRAVLIGDTGSGKTFLGERMAAYFENAQYLDLKREFDPQVPYRKVTDLRQAWRVQGHVLVQPSRAQRHREWYDWYLRQIIDRRKNLLVFVDEVYMVGGMHSQSYPAALSELAAVGRSKKIGLWCGIQRPKFAPTMIFAQAEHWYIFPLSPTDLDVLRGWVPDEALEAVAGLAYDYSFVHVQKVKGGRKVVTVYGPLAA